MGRKTWTIDLDGTSHEVVLHWSYWGGKRKSSWTDDISPLFVITLEVDGREVEPQPGKSLGVAKAAHRGVDRGSTTSCGAS